MFDLNKKEKPFTSFGGFGGGGLGLAGGGISAKTYVDDVFSTTVYDGTGSSRSVVTGIDNTEKSLLWVKSRQPNSRGHALYDTERGAGIYLSSNGTFPNSGSVTDVTAFNSNGFTTRNDSGQVNGSNETYVAWNFKAAPGFFDVVTYTGNGTAGRTISHSLGSVPGMIIVKVTSGYDDWFVYHRSLGDQRIKLNSTNPSGSTAVWNNTAPTSSVFSVGDDGYVNGSGLTYVAYLFAHDNASFGTDEDESIIKCDSYTGNGSTTGPVINLGFEPQWLIIKASSGTGDWYMYDSMRGLTGSGANDAELYASTSDSEYVGRESINVTPTGFQLATTNTANNANGVTYIYTAIRRQNKPPEAGTDVFHAYYGTPASNSTITTGFPFDMQIAKEASSASSHRLLTRKLGLNTWDTTGNYTGSLQPGGNDEEQMGNLSRSVGNTGFGMPTAYANNLMIFHSFRSAAGFMDVVAYEGTGSNTTVNHNLEATPELMIIKRRNPADDWAVYSSTIGTATHLELNSSGAQKSSSDLFNNTNPTASVFSLSTNSQVNGSSYTYIAYLFATLPGISKVGSYTGTGNDINVDCGFTSGARYILIKRTDSAADWYVWDYARGIVSGNDPYFKMNVGAAQVTNTDYVDPLNAGFTVTSSAPAALNASGGTYLFLAIA